MKIDKTTRRALNIVIWFFRILTILGVVWVVRCSEYMLELGVSRSRWWLFDAINTLSISQCIYWLIIVACLLLFIVSRVDKYSKNTMRMLEKVEDEKTYRLCMKVLTPFKTLLITYILVILLVWGSILTRFIMII